jgi:hypothetical protein
MAGTSWERIVSWTLVDVKQAEMVGNEERIKLTSFKNFCEFNPRLNAVGKVSRSVLRVSDLSIEEHILQWLCSISKSSLPLCAYGCFDWVSTTTLSI